MSNKTKKDCQQNGQSKKARHILKLTQKEKILFLKSFDIILSDCDGVVWMLAEPIPNTGPAIMLLKNADKKFKYVSNNSARTDEEYLQKLATIGVKDTQVDDIVIPVKTIIRYIKRHIPGQSIFSICMPDTNEVYRKNGIDVKAMIPQTNLRTEDLIEKLKPSDEVGAVVLDLNFNITFGELARAQQYLLKDDCRLLVGTSDAQLPVSKDFVTICNAGFMNILEESSGKTSIILGKPGALLGTHLKEHFDISDSRRALFIGDNLTADIKFGTNSGFQTLFVLSGASTYEQMLQVPDEFKPDYIADSLADFIEFFASLVQDD